MHSVMLDTHSSGNSSPAMSYSMNAIGEGIGRKITQRT
jgi:hypothetical protein